MEDKEKKYKRQDKWNKENNGRLEAKINKELAEKFKMYIKQNNITYRQWLIKKIEEELQEKD